MLIDVDNVNAGHDDDYASDVRLLQTLLEVVCEAEWYIKQDQQFEIKSYYVCISAIGITVSQLQWTNYWVYFNVLKIRIILSKSQFLFNSIGYVSIIISIFLIFYTHYTFL